MKGIDLLILFVLAVILYFVLRSLWKQRKQGGCAYCHLKDQCSNQKVQLQVSPNPKDCDCCEHK